MRAFLIHSTKFLLTTLFLFSGLIYLLNLLVCNQEFRNSETESNLLILKDSQHYDYLVLGISHARNISRYTHHELFESMTKKQMVNLSQGDGLGGLENQYWYLSYFLKKKNTAQNVIFVLSPTLMYSNKIDKNSKAFYREAIHWNFIRHLLKEGGSNTYEQLFYYIKSKLSHHWWLTKPERKSANTVAIKALDSLEVKVGFSVAYPQGLDDNVFNERGMVLDKILGLIQSKGIKVTIVIPPALFGRWPGHEKVVSYIQRNYPNLKLVDSSLDILDSKYYSDHHHLNTDGMKQWLSKLVKRIEGY